ncbi:Phosphate-selective porin O and P [Arsukibacterium tuosuense]|uniref:Phosphate-selective porin O and P n=1 Tax=Arsukibacterium tuosuense TaxID=1323745 RepID=A0A285IPG1_9GAMM|nr:porin [Arsukibacterium tuosuense]SNY49899.1 Phosphate-selective porin O and P [Arsukibacterium tuosuense]
MKTHCRIALIAAAGYLVTPASFAATPAETDEIKQQLSQLKAQIAALEARLAEQEETQAELSNQQLELAANESAEQSAPVSEDGIKLGGAIRTNYSHTSYSDGNKDRTGDFAFDIFRLNLNGSIGDVLLNAEIRFFDYMTAVKYAYVGYQFTDDWQVQAGITQVPFGNWPYNSHNWFFSTNYYIGLEDDHDLGILFKRQLSDNWQLDLGFFKNDELGGVDGYVGSRADRYSYDIVGARLPGDGIYDDPAQPLGEYNTLSGRFGYHVSQGELKTELGVSALAGGLHNGQTRAGDYHAWAVHSNSHYHNWNLQLQYTKYQYDVDNGADRMAVGAYAFYDSIAAEATSATVNLAYSMPVEWGPVTGLQFYNNYGLVYDKSDGSRDTMMNITGFSVAAGGLFTYFDLVHAKNQPFVGGSASGDSSETERRFNINIGYYF